MAAAQWQAASTASSRSASPAPSFVSGTGTVSSAATIRTTGSLRYVPPAKRAQRNNARVDLELAELHNKLSAESRESAKHTGPNLPTFSLPYCLSKDQLSFLTSRFPRTKFRCTSDVAHDHPIAHTETMVAVEKAKRMVPEGHTIIDLFGDPTSADKFNASQARANVPKRMVAYVAIKTEKDYLRALKWGNNVHADGSMRYREGVDDILSEIDPREDGVDPIFGVQDSNRLTYLCKHTMYYLTDEEIAGLLRPAGSRMLSVVHRHPDTQGSLFDGECTYGKIGDTVEQVNSLTLESYVHRDLSFLWTSRSKVIRTVKGSFVWTFHMVTKDTWIIELTGCNGRLDERFAKREAAVGPRAACVEMNEHAVRPTHYPHPALSALPGASCTMVGSVPVVRFKSDLLPPTHLSCPELFDFLRMTQVGKPRDAERLHDLFSLARSHVANGSDFPGKRNFKLPAADVAGHVVLAFISGLTAEVDLLRSLEAYRIYCREHKALLDGSAVVINNPCDAPESAVRSVVSVLKRVNSARTKKDALSAVLEAVE